MKRFKRVLLLLLVATLNVGTLSTTAFASYEDNYYGTDEIDYDIWASKDNKNNVKITLKGAKNINYDDCYLIYQKPVVVVTYKGKTLKENVDYVLRWEKNPTSAGKHYVYVYWNTTAYGHIVGEEIQGFVEYHNSLFKSETIKNVKVTPKKGKIKVKYTKNNVDYYLIEYSTSKNFEFFTKGITTNIIKTKKTSYTIKNLKKNKKYYVRVIGVAEWNSNYCFTSDVSERIPISKVFSYSVNNTKNYEKLKNKIFGTKDKHILSIKGSDINGYFFATSWSKTKSCKTKK